MATSSFCIHLKPRTECDNPVCRTKGVNQITNVEIKMLEDGYYRVYVTKCFEEQYGGGEATICVSGALSNIHVALDVVRMAVTVTRTHREAFEAENKA